MRKDPNIQNELNEIAAPILSKLTGKNPFLVPEGYFSFNAETTQKVVKDEEPNLQFLNAVSKDYFSIPKNYFQDNAEWAYFIGQTSEPNLQILGGLSKDYLKVPDNFFQEFAEKLWNKIGEEEELDKNLKHLNDKEAMAVPDNYFANLPNRIMDRIKEEESESSQLLEEIKEKGNPFSVPNAYFENFPQRVLNRIQEEEGQRAPKVIEMGSTAPASSSRFRQISKVFTAVAAVLVLAVMGTFIFRGPGTDTVGNTAFNLQDELASMSNSELLALAGEADLDEYNIIENMEQDMGVFNFTDDAELELMKNFLLEELDNETLIDYL